MPVTNQLTMANAEYGLEPNPALPTVNSHQSQLPGQGAMSQKQSQQQPHHLISPPLPVPSGNNHFSPIQSPMTGSAGQIPGLPVIHSGQIHHHTAGAFTSLNPRLPQGVRGPPKNPLGQQQQPIQQQQQLHSVPQQRSLINEELQKTSPAYSNQPRTGRPRPNPSYSNQLPTEAETQVEIVEHRQRKERLAMKDIEDLIHLSGPLTEDAVMKTLHTRFQNDSFFVSEENVLLLEIEVM